MLRNFIKIEKTNFLKGLIYFGKKTEIDENYFQEINVLGQKLYDYRLDINTNKRKPLRFNTKNLKTHQVHKQQY